MNETAMKKPENRMERVVNLDKPPENRAETTISEPIKPPEQGMECPFCKVRLSKTFDTRPEGQKIIRWRRCQSCGKKWKTEEEPV